MPENIPSFVTVKGWIIEAAQESNVFMSVRKAKSLAGEFLAKSDPDEYKRITHGDPVGEGVARRWAEFKTNYDTAVAA